VIILVGLIALTFVVNSFLNEINKLDPDQTFTQQDPSDLFEESEPLETDPVTDQAETIFQGEDVINILLVGQDRRENEGNSPQRTDAMILCTVNKKTGTLTMTSFMRDIWVYIPDYYNQRLNMPYKLGGFPLLNKTLEYNFGVSADYNVEIDFSGFMEAIDTIGGVEIELTSAEAKYLNKRGNWDIEENQHWKLKEGANLLTGSQALAYSRIRQIGTDFGRTNRQRTVLTALIEKVKTLGATELFDLARKLMPLIYTDMTNNQILSLIMEMLPMLSNLEIVSQRIPMDKQYAFEKKGGADVIVLSKENLKVNKELLTATMGE
jgi:LCP family protein required for cell wall assembly